MARNKKIESLVDDMWSDPSVVSAKIETKDTVYTITKQKKVDSQSESATITPATPSSTNKTLING